MSSPSEYYRSLPPISKAYGTLCLICTAASELGLYNPAYIALIYPLVFSNFEVWRLITNFFFLGNFSWHFAIRFLMIAHYSVQLEDGPFKKRPADFLWMLIFGASTLLALSVIPVFEYQFLGRSLVFMLIYIWSREYPDGHVNIHGLVTVHAIYLPWAMLASDLIFGEEIMPDLMGVIVGHLYYFLTVLHPLADGRNMLKTPLWVRKLVAGLGIAPPVDTRAEPDSDTNGAFRGRAHRIGRNHRGIFGRLGGTITHED